ncbi:MAG: PAS domain S-box protein, partial [Methylococcaceae bacterium]|nr:PAS domain S-box protein [Methylococcaceae bacterium]
MKANYKIIVWLISAAIMVVLSVAVSFWAFKQVQTSAEQRKHIRIMLDEGTALLSSLKDAETGQRGYLLTGDETFLQPYLVVRDNINAQLQTLRQGTEISSAQKHLDAVQPLIKAKLAALATLIELRRQNDLIAMTTLISAGEGKRLMDAIRIEMNSFIHINETLQAQSDAEFEMNMRNLLIVIVATSLFTLLFALAFAYLFYQETKHTLLFETQRLLALGEEANEKLQQTNLALQVSEENLSVTLSSIGDAVIATDTEGRVTLMNPIAERLTGWTQADALGHPIETVFHIIHQATRQPVVIPVMDALKHGTIQALANHTVLIARDDSEHDIADSCAPIRDRDGQVIGAVLVFRDVSEEYAIQQTLRNHTVRIQTIFNTVVDGIITFQADDGNIETVNSAAERIFGYTAAELIKQNINLLIPNDALVHYRTNNETHGSGHELIGRRKDGNLFAVEMTINEMLLGNQRYFTCILRDITVRKQAEERLIKEGALQNAIFNSANFSSIATDAKGVIQIFNVGAERMLGYTAAEVMNKITPAEISDSYELTTRAKALSEEFSTPITQGFESLVFKATRCIEDIYELTYIRKDGSRFPAVVSVTALRDAKDNIIGYLLIGTDNTARKRAEEELIKAGALQSAIFNSANFSSIATDAKGVIQIFNVGAERMLGYTAAEVMNKITPADISDSQELITRAEVLTLELKTPITSGFEALVFKASRGIEDIYELTYIRKDGSRFPAVVSVTALRDARGGIIGYLLIGTDNTARKRLDTERVQLYDALKEKNIELEVATSVAEKSNLAKSEFLSKMSHELRTPLNAILGFAQLLEVGSPPPTTTQIVRLQQIIKAGWYLLELINEILDLAVIESGKLSLSREAVSMTEVMRECQSMIESQAEIRSITMIFMPFDNTLFAYGDRTRIKQIIINLLSNAIKYNRDQGTVEVSCTSTPEHIGINIKDSGKGLTAEQMAQLFQPFNRLGQESGSEEGTGIGLVVTKQLVELMGGSIRVNSTVGVGSEFYIELLRDVTPQLDMSNITLTKLLPPASKNTALRTLLYVEDNPANLMLVEQIIEAHPQLYMLSAHDGYQGLSLARSHIPDVILM